MLQKFKWFLAILFIAALPVGIVSCGDDDEKNDVIIDEPTTYDELIVGIWSDDGKDDWYDGGGSYGSNSYGYEFKKNGTCYMHGSIYGAGTYLIIDNKLIITINANYGTHNDTYIIKKLTKDMLVLQYSEYYDDDYEVYYRIN